MYSKVNVCGLSCWVFFLSQANDALIKCILKSETVVWIDFLLHYENKKKNMLIKKSESNETRCCH